MAVLSGGVTMKICGCWVVLGRRGGGLHQIGAELANYKRVAVALTVAERDVGVAGRGQAGQMSGARKIGWVG